LQEERHFGEKQPKAEGLVEKIIVQSKNAEHAKHHEANGVPQLVGSAHWGRHEKRRRGRFVTIMLCLVEFIHY
jgi:hypothetical protein